MAPNVLAVAPRDCIMLEGNPITETRLKEAGCRVRTYRGNEISLKAEGGATCLTRPIHGSGSSHAAAGGGARAGGLEAKTKDGNRRPTRMSGVLIRDGWNNFQRVLTLDVV